MKEYREFYKSTKNLTKEYQPRNLKVLDVNGHLLSEKKKVLDRWKEYFQGKLSNQGQLNTEFDLEEVDFNVTNQDITKLIYPEVRNIILKFKHQKAPGIDGVTVEILQKVSPLLWRCIHSLNKTMWNNDDIQAEGKMRIVCSIHKKVEWNKCDNYR